MFEIVIDKRSLTEIMANKDARNVWNKPADFILKPRKSV